MLVTGSSGFVGKHLVAELRRIGAKVITFDKVNNKDVTKWQDFNDIPKVDLVYHLAAILFVPFSQENPRLTYEINVQGTANVLEFCRLNNAKIIFPSSYVYGNPKYLPIDEKHPIDPTNPYTMSKVIGEMLCKAYNKDYGLKCIILRFFNIMGPEQSTEFLIPTIINQIKRNREVVLKDLNPKRDFLYITDAINAYVKAGEYDKLDFGIFNIGYGKSYSVKEIAEILCKFSGKNIKIKSLNKTRNGEIMQTIADIRNAKRFLKWKPVVDVDDGLKRCFITP